MNRNTGSKTFLPVAAILRVLVAGTLLLSTSVATSAQSMETDDSILPRPTLPFDGTLAPTEADSTAVFPTKVAAPDGAPNIVLVMTDDVGFASVSTFGGSAPTPNLDRLAEQGLRYNRFHTTGICSPTRAALLTGRNHHAVGVGSLSDLASPYPGYTARITPAAATIARILRDNGYNTAMFGKDHNVPPAERSTSGPFDQWPTGQGRGFDHFYGFVGGDTDQWQPALYEGTSAVDSTDRPDDYLLDRDLANRTINWIHNQKAAAPDKPFFVYFSTGSGHAPHQAPADWIARFKGDFDHGWDEERKRILSRQKAMGIVPADTKLSPRPDVIPAWDSLSGDEKKVYARFMEVYAASLAFQDEQIGRILSELQRMGIADNTLVIFIEGDNGASGEGGEKGSLNEMVALSSPHKPEIDTSWLAENLDILGGPDTYQGYPVGWTYASNTPFPWFKQMPSHLGGMRNGLVISWPERIKHGGQVRSQYHHVIDIAPTILEAARIKAPVAVDGIAQLPFNGKSMAYSFDDADAASPRTTQYYEVHGNRGIYHQGWFAGTSPRNMPWNVGKAREGSDISTYAWELYDLDSDFSQSNNLAREHPEKLEQLQAVFDAEARKNNVYPIHDSGGQARAMRMMRASGVAFKTEYVYWGKDIQVQLLSAPPIYRLPFSIEAEIEVPEQGGEGVILAAGSYFSGWSFYLQDGRPVAYAAVSPLPLPGMQSRVAAADVLSPGKHMLRFDYSPTGTGGTLLISVDGEEVATGPIAKHPEIIAGNGESFDTGRDTNDPVSPDYDRQGVFNGQIYKIKVNVKLPKMASFLMGLQDLKQSVVSLFQ
jgi:arylsulfatase A-like enzyme